MEKRTITFKASDELWEKLSKIAKDLDRSVSWVIKRVYLKDVIKDADKLKGGK
jgi:predicted transcriptional regulator